MLYFLILEMIILIIINYFVLKEVNIKNTIIPLILYSILNYLTYKNSFFSFHIFQLLLMLISYLTVICFYKRKDKKKYFIFLIFMLCSFYTEFFIFNFRHFTTFLYKETIITNYKIDYKKKNSTVLIINKINKKVNNIYLDVKVKSYGNVVPIIVRATDEGNKELYSLGTQKYITTIPQSHYFHIHSYGKTKKLFLDITFLGENFKIKKISINKNVPIFFNYLRFLVLFVLVLIIYIIRPSSSLYKYKILDKIKYKRFMFILYILISGIIFFCLTNINPAFSFKVLDSYDEYYDLTESILDGHFYLNEKAPKMLKDMNNPYDYTERTNLFEKNGLSTRYKWDYAYFKGKFYVYFGILPVIVLFLPFYILFHVYLPLHYAVFIFLIFGVCSALYFVYQLCKKYFSKTSLITYFLGVTMLIFTCGFVFMARRPEIYVIPIISALDFTLLGLGFWLNASTSKKNQKIKIFLGSLSIALTSACRPQFLISFIFFYPILKDNLYKDKKCNIKNIVCFTLPFVIIGSLVMYYNYARFGSVFDFGASYNLTFNDMTHRGFYLDRIGLGLFTYLFQPVNIIQTFPYINKLPVSTNYLGTTIFEPFLGGLFFSTSVVFIGFYLLKHKKDFDKNIYLFGLVSYISAIIIIIFDTQMAGVLPRYICDFAWLFLLPTLFVLFYSDNVKDKDKRLILKKKFLTLFVISLIYQFLIIFICIDVPFEQYSSNIFHTVRYFIEFWL